MIEITTRTLTNPWVHERHPWLVFRTTVPIRCRYLAAHWRMQLLTSGGAQLYLRTQQFGAEVVDARLLVVTPRWSRFNGTPITDPAMDTNEPLPNILLGPNDPPDSAELQWSIWQGRRIDGTLSADVYNVTGMRLEGIPD